MDSNNSQGEEEITPEHVEHFNKICSDATELMHSYKQQSQDLKKEISSMVNIYNQNADPSQAVPLDKIMEITQVYEKEMKDVHNEYEHLESELKKQEEERSTMIDEITLCFQKLEKMQQRLKEKKAKKEAEGVQENKIEEGEK